MAKELLVHRDEQQGKGVLENRDEQPPADVKSNC